MAGRGKFSPRKNFIPPGQDLDRFHGCQLAREFQAGADIGFDQRGIICQNLRKRLPSGNRTDDIGSQNAGSAHNGLAVTNGRVQRDTI